MSRRRGDTWKVIVGIVQNINYVGRSKVLVALVRDQDDPYPMDVVRKWAERHNL